MLKLLKNVVKAFARSLVRARLNWWPVSPEQAEKLAIQTKAYPSIFGSLNYRRQVNLPAGIQMELGFADVIERSLLTTGHWDPLVEKCLQSLLNPGDTFLDVGANIGYFSMMASKIVGDQGIVVSFEPSARALTKLTSHACLNQCRNLLVCSHAVGETTSRTYLNWAAPSNIGGSTINRGIPSQGAIEPILVRRLDDVCRDLSLKPNLIKMDIEGFELFALRGAKETLATFHPNVVCELTEAFLRDHGQSSQALIQFMLDLGYRAFLLSLSSTGQVEATACTAENTPDDQAEVLFSFLKDPLARP